MDAAEYKAHRENVGTQTEVAELLGITKMTIIRREQGVSKLTREMEIAILHLEYEAMRKKS